MKAVPRFQDGWFAKRNEGCTEVSGRLVCKAQWGCTEVLGRLICKAQWGCAEVFMTTDLLGGMYSKAGNVEEC